MRHSFKSLLSGILASCVIGTVVQAQDDATAQITLELNRVADTAEGTCQVVFFGQNGLDRGLSAVTWRLAVFDADGVFNTLLSLPLGELDPGKRRILQFNLPAACSDISEIIVNDVAACLFEDGTEADVCLDDVVVSSRAEIAFGL
ncbi:hypothetical protein BC777_3775 [Yoonia maricola]|uniref:Uncharacterized protein n=1 Tax=Yoonia maricola TaxID=420999 RepID=A0A2M8VZZ0_9RHOB|nr:hypothetical protein [Yoonia maricola]PJI84235.1 hypothetical protein BC777_3775 [Yoonia maricola]